MATNENSSRRVWKNGTNPVVSNIEYRLSGVLIAALRWFPDPGQHGRHRGIGIASRDITAVYKQLKNWSTGCPKTREHLNTGIRLSIFRIRAFQVGPDLAKWQRIVIFVSVNLQINFSIELDVRVRNSEPLGKWTIDQSSYISPRRDWRQSRSMTILAPHLVQRQSAMSHQPSIGNTPPPRNEIGRL
jgi:hypothetical protein